MIPAAFAAFQGLKLGTRLAIIGSLLALIVGSYAGTYFKGKHDERKRCNAEADQAIAAQTQKMLQETVKVHALDSQVVKTVSTQERNMEQEAEAILKKKRSRHGQAHKKVTIPSALVELHDELRGLSMQTGSDPRPPIRAPEYLKYHEEEWDLPSLQSYQGSSTTKETPSPSPTRNSNEP